MQNQKIEIYSTPTCHFCHMAKDFLSANNIKFIDYDVQSNIEKRKEMIDKTGQLGVPVIVIDEKIIIGFDEDSLKKELNIK